MRTEGGKAARNASSTSLPLFLTQVSETSARFDVGADVDVDGIARFDVRDSVDVDGIVPSSTMARFDVGAAVDVDGIAPSSTTTALLLAGAGRWELWPRISESMALRASLTSS